MAKTAQGHIIIKNVRCSFPNLYKEDVKEDGQKFARGITILLDKKEHAAAIKEIAAEINGICKEKPKIKAVVAKKPHLVCLKDGDRDEYGDVKMVKASNSGKILVMHKDKSRATEADDPIYSGCRVNVKLDIWGQDNQYGKRINAKVIAVQFNGDDASFDGSYVSEDVAEDGFESLDDDGFGDVVDDGIGETAVVDAEEELDFL